MTLEARLDRLGRQAVDALNSGRGARPAMALAMVGAAVLLWLETRGHTLFLDEWNFLLGRDGITVDGILQPTFGHLLAIPMLMYRGMWDIWGIDTQVPERLAMIFFDLLCSGLLFVYLERRVGGWFAFAGASLMLVLGTGWEVNATTDGVAATISISGGLAMLLALDREDLKGDIAASLFLAWSLYSFGTGLPFLVGAIVLVSLRQRERLTRAWVWAAPTAIYLVWRVWASARFEDSSEFDIHNLANLPSTIVDSLGGSLAAITGLFRQPGIIGGTGFRLDIGDELAIAVLILGAFVWIRGARVRGRVWATLAMYFAFWVAVAMVLGTIRPALDTAPRYFYPGVMFLLIAAAEIWRVPGRLNGRAWTVAALVFACAAVANAFQLHYADRYIADISGVVRAELGGLELARGQVDDGFLPDAAAADIVGPVGIPGVTAGGYFAAIDKFGSPAYSFDKLTNVNPTESKAADAVLVRALGLSLAPDAAPAPRSAPRLVEAENGEAPAVGRCLKLTPQAPGAYFVLLTEHPGLIFDARKTAPGPAASVSIGRFSDTEDIPVGPIAGGQSLKLVIPPRPAGSWHVRVTPGAPVLACNL